MAMDESLKMNVDNEPESLDDKHSEVYIDPDSQRLTGILREFSLANQQSKL
jgi:hypothetical protein